jgi:RNA polymerase sigma-32 factor
MIYGIAAATRNARRHILTKTEETRLHAAYIAGDDAAGRRIVTSYLPMLMKTARSYDAISIAVAAFMENMTRYDPAKGARMWTYLAMPVSQAVLSYNLDQKAFFPLKGRRERRAAIYLEIEKKKLGASGRPLTGREADIVAAAFGVSENLVKGLDDDMSIMRTDPLSHDRSDHHGIEDPERADGHLDFEQRHDHERLVTMLHDALAVLNERERQLISRRFKDDPDPLRTIGADIGVSGERVRQIEAKALLRLRRTMRHCSGRPSQAPVKKNLGFKT